MPPDTQLEKTDFVYTGPGTLAGRYLRRFWQPVFISSKLIEGRPVSIRILSEDFTLYRGQSGTPHLVAHRCPHRGVQLSVGWVEGDSIRCYYHGWRFDESGQCVEQPVEREPFCDKVKIASYPTQEYLGCVFAYLGEGDPPPLHRWPEFEREIQEGGTLEATAEILPCNYFQSAENIMDDVHVAFAHRDSFLNSQIRRSIPKIAALETSFGLTEVLHHPDRTERIHFIMPNMCYLSVVSKPLSGGNHVDEGGEKKLLRSLFWYVPIDDISHLHFEIAVWPPGWPTSEMNMEGFSPPAEEIAAILAGRKRVSEISEHPYHIVIQDGVAVSAQGAIVDRSKERLGTTDVAVIRLRKIWMRELRLLAEGKPPTQFGRPDPEQLRREEAEMV